MKYSIIIPTLNEEKLLGRLLEQLNSIKKEFDFEIIISDGGSKDKTIEIALQHSDILKIHTENYKQNIAMGRNEGAKLANGEILIFINGDCLIKNPKFFFAFLHKKFVNSDYLALTCKIKVFPEEEILLDKLYHSGFNIYFRFLNNIGVGMGRGECQVVKKDVFQKVGGYNITLAAGEDFDLFKRIRKIGKTLFTTELCVFESPRRFRKLGYKNVTWTWIKNGISVAFKNRSISKEWEQVR